MMWSWCGRLYLRFFFSLSCLQAWISSLIARKNVKHWATRIGAGCPLLSLLMDARLRITVAIFMYPVWILFQTLKCLKHQKPSQGQRGPSPPLAKRRPFTAPWRGRNWMDCCLIHERLTNHHIWVSTVQKAARECSLGGNRTPFPSVLTRNRTVNQRQ